MSTPQRILFLCAHRSVRALMAASLLSERAWSPWEIWHTPINAIQEELELAREVLEEIGILLLTASPGTEPHFGLTWDVGIILCSGYADT